MNWFAQHRQEWIAETLRVFGYIQRKHIVRKFGVTILTATTDLQQYQKDTGGIVYNMSRKRFEVVDPLRAG